MECYEQHLLAARVVSVPCTDWSRLEYVYRGSGTPDWSESPSSVSSRSSIPKKDYIIYSNIFTLFSTSHQDPIWSLLAVVQHQKHSRGTTLKLAPGPRPELRQDDQSARYR